MRNLAIRHALGLTTLSLVFVAANPASAEHDSITVVARAPQRTLQQLKLEKRARLTRLNAQYDAERRKLDAELDAEIRRAKSKAAGNRAAFSVQKDRLDLWYLTKSTNLDHFFKVKRAEVTAQIAVEQADVTGRYSDHRAAVQAQKAQAVAALEKELSAEQIKLDAQMAYEILRAKGKSRGNPETFRTMKARLDVWYENKAAGLARANKVRRAAIAAKFVPLGRGSFAAARARRLREQLEEREASHDHDHDYGREDRRDDRYEDADEIERRRRAARRARERARRADEIERERRRQEELRRQREREERRRVRLRKERIERELAIAAKRRDAALREADHRYHHDLARARARLRHDHGHRHIDHGRSHGKSRKMRVIRAKLQQRLAEEQAAILRRYAHEKRVIYGHGHRHHR